MVSSLSIAFMIISMLIAVLMPIFLMVYFYKKEKISLLAVLIGVMVFVVFQLATRIPLLSYLGTLEWYRTLSSNIWAIALFLGLTAGLFEEVGRYIAMKLLMKNKLEWKNGIAFGIGHGGIEAILIVGLPILSNIILSIMINAGIFEALTGAQLPAEVANQLKGILINTPSATFLAGGYERIMTMAIQIGFSVMVLYAVKLKKPVYLLYAILLHAVVDSPVVILSSRGLNIWLIELVVTAWAVLAIVFVAKSKEALSQKAPVAEVPVEL